MLLLLLLLPQGAADKHARVRWASCQALGQLCTDLGPDLQASARPPACGMHALCRGSCVSAIRCLS